jgi:hypothetical protein
MFFTNSIAGNFNFYYTYLGIIYVIIHRWHQCDYLNNADLSVDTCMLITWYKFLNSILKFMISNMYTSIS